MPQETHNIPQKKQYFCIIRLKNVILLGKMSILRDIWYLSKTARKTFGNIERLGIFYKFIFSRGYIMLMR